MVRFFVIQMDSRPPDEEDSWVSFNWLRTTWLRTIWLHGAPQLGVRNQADRNRVVRGGGMSPALPMDN